MEISQTKGGFYMFTKLFWKDTVERVVSTAAQAGIALLTVDGFDVANFDVESGLAVVGVAALVSFLKALVAGKVTDSTVSPASLAE
jgi:hypothetical protein